MTRKIFNEIISFLFILLFVYAALNKLNDYQKFVIQLGQSPLLLGLGAFVAPAVILSEVIIPAILVFSKTRLIGYYASFSLMTLFTGYIIAILAFSDNIPCSCGGILEKLGWTEHLLFNAGFVGLSIIGVVLETKETNMITQSQVL